MALPVREPIPPLARLHAEIDHMLKGFPTARCWPQLEGGGRVPSIDLYERDGNLVVEAELPGVDKKDVKIRYTDSTLSIEGVCKTEEEEKRDAYLRSERHSGRFYRTVLLPHSVDFANAKAKCKDGVLTLTLPKAAVPEADERTITISE